MVILLFETNEWKRSGYLRERTYQSGQLCYQSSSGDISDKLLFIKEGNVVVQVLDVQGRKNNITFLEEGDLVNSEMIWEEKSQNYLKSLISYQVIALKKVVIQEIDKEFFLSHLYANPREYHHLIGKFIFNAWMIIYPDIISQKEVHLRFAWTLLHLSKSLGIKNDKWSFNLPVFVTYSFIANFMKMKIARVKELAHFFYQKGIIWDQGEVICIDQKRLIEYIKNGD